MDRTIIRRGVCAAAVTAALLVAVAGTRADVISSGSNFIQPGFVYEMPGAALPISFGNAGGSVGSLSGFRIISTTGQPSPVGEATTRSTQLGTGSMTFTDNAGIVKLLSFQYQSLLASRRRDTGGTRATMDIAVEGMDFAGLPSWISLRESPTIVSTGLATVEDLGNGQFRIVGSFEIYTEISFDSGQSWIPASGPVHVDLVPTPSVAALMSLGGLMAARRRRS